MQRTSSSPEDSVPELATAQPAHLLKCNRFKCGQTDRYTLPGNPCQQDQFSLLDLRHPEGAVV